jgi:NACHT domain
MEKKNQNATHGVVKSIELLRKISTAAFHNSEERFDPPKCHPNTCLAVLCDIMKWIKWEGELKSFIMWVYGPAGSGKSAIAQTVAEMCEEEMILLASFFFSRNDPSRSNARPLIATIVYQITFNLPGVRDAVLRAVERDPRIFSKSLAVQLKYLIVEPLQPLIKAGFFNGPTSRRLVVIDGLDECSDPKVQRNIVEVLANAQQEHKLPLIFLFTSRPEHHISVAFRALSSVTTHIALNQSYLLDKDIHLFLTDKFEQIKSTHPLRVHIPPQWPLPDVLKQLIKQSSGQFIYASTIIDYVSSIRHKPHDRLDIILGIRPHHDQRDRPFAELDALYMQILAGVDDIDPVLEILAVLVLSTPNFPMDWSLSQIGEFLSFQPGDVELYLGDLNSLVYIGANEEISIVHASFSNFLMDPTRSDVFWINPPARHMALARHCLNFLQPNGKQCRSSRDIHILIPHKDVGPSWCGSVTIASTTIAKTRK